MSTLAQSLKQGTMISFEEGIFGHYSAVCICFLFYMLIKMIFNDL